MRGRFWRLATALGVAVALSPLSPILPGAHAAAQRAASASTYRYTLEGYLAQYSLDDGVGISKRRIGGFGARLGFNRDQPDRAATSVLDRAAGSLFATYTAGQGTPDATTLHAGFQTDFSILPRPAGGVFDPFFGVSLGILRTSIEDIVTRRGRVNRSDLALTPGAGVRLPLFNGIGARGDVRVPLVFGTRTTANAVAEGGIYFSF